MAGTSTNLVKCLFLNGVCKITNGPAIIYQLLFSLHSGERFAAIDYIAILKIYEK